MRTILYQEITVNDLAFIPETMLSRLLAIKDAVSDTSFQIGDITNELYLLLVAERGASQETEPVRKMAVYALVGRLVGKPAASVRRYAWVAEFYAGKDRGRYSVLPFSHLAYAAQFLDSWETILDTSLDYMDRRGGVPPSVEMLNELRLRGLRGDAIPEHGLLPPREADDPGEMIIQPGEGAHPSDDEDCVPSPQDGEETDPEGAAAERERLTLMDIQGKLATLSRTVAPISEVLEKAEMFPDLGRVRVEVAQIVLRLRRVVEAVDYLLGSSREKLYLNIPE